MSNKLLLSLLFYSLLRTFSASLTTSYTGRPCPGEEVILTCTVTGDRLTWESPGEPQVLLIRGMAMVNDSGSTLLSGAVTVTLISVNSTTMTSTLTLSQSPIQIPEDGIRFTCVDVGSVTVQNAVSPSFPVSIRHSVESSTADRVSVSVQWDPPTDNGGRDDLTYTVTISPPAQLSATVVTSTSVTVSAVDYNEDYTVSVVATNCAGNSTAEEYSFRVVSCADPQFQPGVGLTSDPSVVYLNGSIVTYGCTGTSVSDSSTCGSNRLWSPDTTSLQCPDRVICSRPSPPANGGFVGTIPFTSLVGEMIYYTCDDGLFPEGNFSSDCGSNGMWTPNPGEIVCTVEQVTCSQPDNPTNGFVVQISNSTAVFGCNAGFSPQVNRTANCNASGHWSPSPEEIMCQLTVSPDELIAPIAGGVVGGIVVVVLFIAVVLVALFIIRKHNERPTKSDQVIEMTGQFQEEYSELRHDGPKNSSLKSKPPPTDSECYDRITHNLNPGTQAYDDVTIDAEGTQRLPGYGRLDNVAPVEAVVYADLGVVTKKRSEAPEVDQHTVTYSTLDMAATSRMKASTMPAPSKGGSAEQADKLLNLDQTLVQLRPVQSRWKELADALRVPETYIQQVDDMCGKDHASSMTEIIDYWMRSCGGRPTWRELADALKRIKEDSLAQQLMSIYDTGQLPVELDMNEVPKELYKYDNAPPPPVPARSPTVTDTESPGLSRTLPPPSKPPRHGGDHPPPSRPPKPPSKNESPAPPRPPKPPPKN